MPIDSRDKRMSMLNWHGQSRFMFEPDGTIDQNDKQTRMNRYGGILWTALTAGLGGQSTIPIWMYYFDKLD